MATILVDYENVWCINGMKGVEYLNSEDTLYMFYSQCCNKIRADYMEAIKTSKCDFMTYKLIKPGRNALDFYIASECGSISQRGETQIAIISKDKGFSAVADFFRVKQDLNKTLVVTASSIEKGLMALNDSKNKDRRYEIKKNSQMLDIAIEQARIQERNTLKNKLKTALIGTQYEYMTSKIIRYIDSNQGCAPKQLYTGSLHHFGRADGAAIYRILKEVI